ncbi:hypothetical protein Q9966_004028 [Columba livia]|nr:hypothetical protein Q9966_004028 [Columba livia]
MAADITPVASDSDGAGAGNAVALALLAGATVLLPSSAGFSPRESAGVVPEQKLEGISYSQPQPGEAVANPSYVLITNSCGLTYTDLIQALARSGLFKRRPRCPVVNTLTFIQCLLHLNLINSLNELEQGNVPAVSCLPLATMRVWSFLGLPRDFRGIQHVASSSACLVTAARKRPRISSFPAGGKRLILTCLWETLETYGWKMDHRGEGTVFVLSGQSSVNFSQGLLLFSVSRGDSLELISPPASSEGRACAIARGGIGALLISRGTIIWQDGNPELQLMLTSSALGIQLGVQTSSAFPIVLMPMALGLEQDSPAWSHPKQLSMKMSIGLIRGCKECTILSIPVNPWAKFGMRLSSVFKGTQNDIR